MFVRRNLPAVLGDEQFENLVVFLCQRLLGIEAERRWPTSEAGYIPRQSVHIARLRFFFTPRRPAIAGGLQAVTDIQIFHPGSDRSARRITLICTHSKGKTERRISTALSAATGRR